MDQNCKIRLDTILSKLAHLNNNKVEIILYMEMTTELSHYLIMHLAIT